jgi:uncharacterized protein (DUF2141 family)
MENFIDQSSCHQLKNTCASLNPNTAFNEGCSPYWRRIFAVQNLALCILIFGSVSANAAPDSGELKIEVTGFVTDKGHAVAKLFSPKDDVLKKGRWEISEVINGGHATLTFHALPSDDYAVVVFHDANNNGEIDHNFIGFPNESLGFSNEFKISITSGFPRFDKLRFTHGVMPQTIFIKVGR